MSTVSTTSTEASVVADLAIQARRIDPLGTNLIGVHDSTGAYRTIDLQHYDGEPRRKTGNREIDLEESLIAYVRRHGGPATELYASEVDARIVAVINSDYAVIDDDPETATAGWGDHRASLGLLTSPAWEAWTGASGSMLPQTAFAELVEDRLPDFVDPAGAYMLELAQAFHASSKGAFESTQRLSNGETSIAFRDEINATAGKRGELTIPQSFTLALPPFEGGPVYKVTARFRHRISNGQLFLGCVLDRADDVHRLAFSEVARRVAEETACPLFFGRPS